MVKLRTATNGDKELYRNLFNMLQDHLAQYSNEFREVDEAGYYDQDTVECYFNGDQSIMPYVITYDDKTVGLVVLSKPPYVKSGCDYCIQELFIMGAYRGKGIAQEACKQLVQHGKGKYCMIVLRENIRAVKFWRKFIAEEMADIKEEQLDEQSMVMTFTVV